MTTRKFVQPDISTKAKDLAGARAYMAELETALAVLANMNHFAPYSGGGTGWLPLKIGPGILRTNLGIVHGTAGGNTTEVIVKAEQTPTFSPALSNLVINRIGLDPCTGAVKAVYGTSDSVPPAYPDHLIPICQILPSPTSVGGYYFTNAHIIDERAWVSSLPGAISGGSAGAFGDRTPYKVFATAGTYSVTKPHQAKMMRLTLIGSGYGSGQITTNYKEIMTEAQDLTVVVGGSGGTTSVTGTDNPFTVSQTGAAGADGAVLIEWS